MGNLMMGNSLSIYGELISMDCQCSGNPGTNLPVKAPSRDRTTCLVSSLISQMDIGDSR